MDKRLVILSVAIVACIFVCPILIGMINLSKEDKVSQERFEDIARLSMEILKQKELDAGGVSISSANAKHEVEIILPYGKQLDETKVNEAEKLIENTISQESNTKVDIKIKQKMKNQARDESWGPVFSSIIEETSKKYKEYRGFAYSFYPEPLQIIIKTDLLKSKSRNPDEKVTEIVEYVEALIDKKTEEIGIEKVAFQVIVRDKNNKSLN